MKVVSAKAMAQLEAVAYKQGYTDQDFMEQAGKGIAAGIHAFTEEQRLPQKAILLCGKGNNAGDAFVAGCHLIDQGYSVLAVQLDALEHCSPLCQQNAKRFMSKGGRLSSQLQIEGQGVLIDGLFGTGFKGAVREPYASLIEAANRSSWPILAVDIPSGLDGSTGQAEGSVIQATATFFLGLPKTGFFLKDGWNAVGKLRAVNFGLPDAIIEGVQPDFLLLTQSTIAPLLPAIKRCRHKYQAGYVIGLAGSPDMPGAALLSSLAALRGGAGMARLLHPEGMQSILSNSPYELIKIPYQMDKSEDVLTLMKKAGATFVGPGLGRSSQTASLLQAVMPHLEKPCVVDADALTLFADQAFELPSQAILTPHTGEMQTLLHRTERLSIDLETLHTCQQYADQHGITLILKGAPTFIFHPGSPILVNPTGDPGMATAGSGDVLTGLLASLLSQGLSPRDAAAVGVYVHGLAGEYAAQARGTSAGVMATDLIAHFADAYRALKPALFLSSLF
ncbi:bifunctional ADP-dependent NAD(P)H-hydrate dehydratase/NAD(P)H-hydrate epimerase [Candidatus Protochlamydia phocaeensis]|uniref:bifunctional ADP-dependent NAD(P)H-hydrate dehydratase/NAD(P)H-hydrate epimerase n=1 Tax=Candidatus Protochlamydia phocaeensis TaxID=1414722 RepID=UPI000838EEAB|nr:bifunctional ADP-dependent NAD(P)H-hydrate dehydratase/NAD(P)H-hydrate epimerase [Candidatus Protochlamydia phocaeensis]